MIMSAVELWSIFVPRVGIEPTLPVKRTRFWVSRVYQFRHRGTSEWSETEPIIKVLLQIILGIFESFSLFFLTIVACLLEEEKASKMTKKARKNRDQTFMMGSLYNIWANLHLGSQGLKSFLLEIELFFQYAGYSAKLQKQRICCIVITRNHMDSTQIQAIVQSLFSVTSIWSVIARGAIWFVIATVVIISTDTPDPEKSLKDLKANLGFVVMFLVLSGGLVYLLFGYSPAT